MRTATGYIVLHCAATPPHMDVDIKDIDKWHKERGFLSVGYHYFIKRDGTRQTGRPINEMGAHVSGYNHKSVGICMAGGVGGDGKTPENNFTEAQWATLQITLRELREAYPLAQIVGHYQLDAGKACPSFNVPQYLTAQSTSVINKNKPSEGV